MTRVEIQVDLDRLDKVAWALRDLRSLAPQHVAEELNLNITAIETARRELARLYHL